MRVALLALAIAMAAGGPALAQIALVPELGGTGSDGAFAPIANVVIDSSVQNIYQFTSFVIPAGITVTCVGALPLTIFVQQDIRIDGVLDASGLPGVASNNNLAGGLGGAGGPGGGAGGEGGCIPASPFNGAGQPGQGAAPGQPGVDSVLTGSFTDPVGGGGGGGNATAGQPGGPPNAGTTPSASGAGGSAAPLCRAGSGGGGGGCDIDSPTTAASNDGGGGGGGGGGRLILNSNVGIVLGPTGAIRADGGRGGNSLGNGGGGGGGSGGSIELVAPVIVIDGVLSAVGGLGGAATQSNCGCSPGGAGGDGCILLRGDASPSLNLAAALPAPSQASAAAILTGTVPAGRINVIGVGLLDPWQAALATSLSTPGLFIGGTPFVLNFADPIFGLTFPANALHPVVTGLTGTGPGSINVDLSSFGLVNVQLDVFVQAVQFTPVVRASNLGVFSLSF